MEIYEEVRVGANFWKLSLLPPVRRVGPVIKAGTVWPWQREPPPRPPQAAAAAPVPPRPRNGLKTGRRGIRGARPPRKRRGNSRPRPAPGGGARAPQQVSRRAASLRDVTPSYESARVPSAPTINLNGAPRPSRPIYSAVLLLLLLLLQLFFLFLLPFLL